MKNLKEKEPHVSLGDMSVRSAVETHIDFQVSIARKRGCDVAEIEAIESRALLEWYQFLVIMVLRPITETTLFTTADEERDLRIKGLAARLLRDENSDLHDQQEHVALSIHRQRMRQALRGPRETLLEIRELFESIAESRCIEFIPSLPGKFSGIYDRIVNDNCSN